MYVIHSVLCIQSDPYTLQRYFRRQILKNLKSMYDIQTSLLGFLALLEVCASRFSGTKGIYLELHQLKVLMDLGLDGNLAKIRMTQF